MLDAAKAHQFDVLLIYDPDRLARGMAKQMVIADMLKREKIPIQYVTVRGGDTAEDRLDGQRASRLRRVRAGEDFASHHTRPLREG